MGYFCFQILISGNRKIILENYSLYGDLLRNYRII